MPENYFRQAADYIRQHGWTQNTYENTAGQVCTSGALLKVTRSDMVVGHTYPGSDWTDAVRELNKFVAEPVAYWNDQPGRTEAEVLEVLDQLAEKYDANA